MPLDAPFRSMMPVGLATMALLLSGCTTLPSSGPTARQVERGARHAQAPLTFQVVNLDAAAFQRLVAGGDDVVAGAGRLAVLAREGRVDTIAPGDELQINIYEVGMTLFGGATNFGGASAVIGSDALDSSARTQRLGTIVVAPDGTIRLPYVGRLSVAGSTPYDVQRMIEQALHGKSQSPQALVTVVNSPGNSAYVFGDVSRSGRIPLSAARERLLDAVATSGGAKAVSADTLIRVTRGGQMAEMRLGDIRSGSPDDLTLLPGDRIELVRQPRSFSVFGATSKVSQVPFDAPTVSLAEAVARVGGPNDAQADASAVFLFRYNAAEIAAGHPPVIYRLNMMRPESYFIAQSFRMQDKDVIYIANAASNPVSKFVGIINQLFSPVLSARFLTTGN
ncbi:polysaccharide export outer membrane protein [Sphingomonas sp. YR710]|nr:polysaccharide export outer membrane protein [Sphingomonas sp. YR710]